MATGVRSFWHFTLPNHARAIFASCEMLAGDSDVYGRGIYFTDVGPPTSRSIISQACWNDWRASQMLAYIRVDEPSFQLSRPDHRRRNLWVVREPVLALNRERFWLGEWEFAGPPSRAQAAPGQWKVPVLRSGCP